MSRAPAALFLLADCRGRVALAEAAAVRSFKEDLARAIPRASHTASPRQKTFACPGIPARRARVPAQVALALALAIRGMRRLAGAP